MKKKSSMVKQSLKTDLKTPKMPNAVSKTKLPSKPVTSYKKK